MTLDRRQIGALCIRMDCIVERLGRRVANARSLSHRTVAVTADEVETLANDLTEMIKIVKETHAILRAEEIANRSSPEPIPIR